MPPAILTRAQSRRVDQLATETYGISGLVLMENAGRGATDCLCRLMNAPAGGPADGAPQQVALCCRQAGRPAPQRAPAGATGQQVVLCCGKGNNAGDAFVIARHLEIRGIPARVLLWGEPEELRGDAAANFHVLQKTDVPIEVFGAEPASRRLAGRLAEASWVVDALLGTGAQGEPRPPLDAVIDRLNAASAPILAIDLPSGLDCDTGKAARHTIKARATCTFVAAKPGLVVEGAAPYVGELFVLDIGVPPRLIRDVLAESA